MMWRKTWLIFVLGCLSLSGYQLPTFEVLLPAIACEEIIDPALLAVDLDTIPKDEALAWITENYGERRVMSRSDFLNREYVDIGPGSLIVLEKRPDWEIERVRLLTEGVLLRGSARGTTYEWMAKGHLYRLVYHSGVQNQRLATIDIEFDPQPTLADIERCYGNPKYYESLFLESYEYSVVPFIKPKTQSRSFTLYYPTQGLSFSDNRNGNGHSKPDMTPATPVQTVSILRSGTVVEMMDDMMPLSDHFLYDVTLFPDTWDALEYH